jgi:type III secretion protein J
MDLIQRRVMRKDHCLRGVCFLHFLRRVLLFVVLASLLTGCESRKVIVNGLDEKEANEILVFLSNKGIDAVKVQAKTEGAGGSKAVMWNISVEASQANEAMALLNQVGLPRRRGQNLLGIFSNVGLVPSGMQEKIRYQAGLAEQIASTIRKIDGVLDADVQISFPDEDPLNPGAPKQKITASVYVKHSGVLDDPNAHLTTRIKRLVAGSVNGLDYDNVTVIGDRARFSESPLGGLQGNLGDEERPYYNVWSITLAKESLTRFRIIFFSFTIAILLLLLSLIWFLWKILPLLKQAGGIRKLFSFQSLQIEKKEDEKATIAKSEEPKDEKKEEKKDEQESNDQGGGVT